MTIEIERLKRQIDHEREEEKRNVEHMRTWIKTQEEASRGFLSFIFKRSVILQASERMQHFADLANQHQARANDLKKKLWILERERDE